MSVAHPRIREALRTSDHVCVATTGASSEILTDLLSLAPPANTLVARVDAPLELCLKRIAARDQTNQIQMDAESITQVRALSVAARVEPTFVIENTALSEAELVSIFRSALTFHQRSDRTQA